MACADVDMSIDGHENETVGELIQYYKASEMQPTTKGPLHELLQKQPAVLGTLQMVSGLFSVGVGIMFSLTQEMGESLFTLFRVSQMTGALFTFAGLVTNLLFKYPNLLPTCLIVNSGCIVVAAVAAGLISIDLAHWNPLNEDHLKIELMELCVLGLEVLLSVILCFLFYKERHSHAS